MKTNLLVYWLNTTNQLFWLFHLPCCQQKLKLLAKSIKTIKKYYYHSHIYNIFIYGTLNLFMVVRPSKTQLWWYALCQLRTYSTVSTDDTALCQQTTHGTVDNTRHSVSWWYMIHSTVTTDDTWLITAVCTTSLILTWKEMIGLGHIIAFRSQIHCAVKFALTPAR